MQKKKSWRAHVGGCYLTKEDFPEAENLTFEQAREEETHPPGKEPAIKWVLYAQGKEKGLVMNKTNSAFMQELTGSEYPEDWVGVTAEAYNDLSVRGPDGSKGGIRLRKPKKQEVEIPY